MKQNAMSFVLLILMSTQALSERIYFNFTHDQSQTIPANKTVLLTIDAKKGVHEAATVQYVHGYPADMLHPGQTYTSFTESSFIAWEPSGEYEVTLKCFLYEKGLGWSYSAPIIRNYMVHPLSKPINVHATCHLGDNGQIRAPSGVKFELEK
jgi:hypothetical protein